MQKKEKKKKGKNPRDFHRFRVPDPNPEQFTPVPIHTGSILKFNPYEIFPLEKDGVGVVDRDLPRFSLIFLEHASAFFFFLASFIQNEEEVERGRSPVVARFLELGEKSNGREAERRKGQES